MEFDVRGFCEFEKQHNLFLRQYAGFSYWQQVRMFVCESVFTERSAKLALIAGTQSKWKIGWKVMQEILVALKSYHAMKSIGIHEIIRFRASRGHDRFFAYWQMPEEIDCVDIRSSNDCDDIISGDRYNLLGPYLRANISYVVKKRLGILSKDAAEREFLDTMVDELRARYGRCVSADVIEQLILRYMEYRKQYKPFFDNLFDRVRCKAILVVWYYQAALMVAYEVAKARNIRIIELQHGVIGNHEEYWFEDQRGINNFTPDYFLAFGNQHICWAKMLPSTRCLAMGFPYQDAMIKKMEGIMTETNTVIIYPENDLAFEEVIDVFARCAGELGYRILMKLHPHESERYEVHYPLLAQNPYVEVVTDQSKGIYYWLKLGKHHIMANTTVGYESLVFPHTNIYIAMHVDHQQCQPLLDWGYARGFSTAEELLDLVQSPNTGMVRTLREEVWRKNGSMHIEKFLMELQKQGWPDGWSYQAEETI